MRSAVQSPNSVAPSRPAREGGDAFTLVELLVVIAVLAVLAILILPAVARSLDSARSVQCAGNLRQLGIAVGQFADDNGDRFPRSQHSAAAYRDIPWERSVAARLGSSDAKWKNLLKGVYHCRADGRWSALSYGLNVYFELGPEDDYQGKPATWRRRADVPRADVTVLFAENASFADHIMPNFWDAAKEAEDVDSGRHRGEANYAFVDGHVARAPFAEIYEPTKGLDRWNPGLAR